MDANQPRERLWNKYFIMACLIFTFISLAMNMMNSTMAKYVYSLYGNAKFSGYLNASFAVMAVAARLVGGLISDRAGRRLVVVMGGVIFSLSIICFGMFPYAALLIIFRGLQGFGYSVGTTAANAIGADVLPEKRMTEGIGYMGLGQSLATAVGATIALSLVIGDDYSRVFWVSAAMLLGAVILALICNYEKLPFYRDKMERQKKESAAAELDSYRGVAKFIEFKAMPATITQFFNCSAWAAINSFIVLFADSKGFENPGSFFTFIAIGMVISRLFAGRISDKYGMLSVIVPTMSASICAFSMLAFTNSVYIFYLAGLIIGISQGGVNPILNAAALRLAAPNRRGAAAGTYQISNDVANGAGAVLWGFVIDLYGYTATFIGCVLCLVICMTLAIVFFRSKKTA